jgi:hypothetical protein
MVLKMKMRVLLCQSLTNVFHSSNNTSQNLESPTCVCQAQVLWRQNPESSLDIYNEKQNQQLHIQKCKFIVLKTA